MCGERNSPTVYPAFCNTFDIFQHTDPLPFVPATCTVFIPNLKFISSGQIRESTAVLFSISIGDTRTLLIHPIFSFSIYVLRLPAIQQRQQKLKSTINKAGARTSPPMTMQQNPLKPTHSQWIPKGFRELMHVPKPHFYYTSFTVSCS